jgi:glycopeptide antibiotics resistance protein
MKMNSGKILSRGLLALYLLVLIWLVLFKLTFHISSLLNHHHRSVNLIPFAAPSMVHGSINYGEMIMNCVFFIPFGLLLSVNFKEIRFASKLTFIMGFSLTAELTQYFFAIGATDITDVITNTLGGLIGLLLYDVSNKYIMSEKLDRVIIFLGLLLFVAFISIHVSHFFLRRSG